MSDTYEPVKLNKNWVKGRLKSDPALQTEYEARDTEYNLLDELIKARSEAGLTQKELAERMGKQQSAIGRLERTLANPSGSVSLASLKEYAIACGKRLDIRMID